MQLVMVVVVVVWLRRCSLTMQLVMVVVVAVVVMKGPGPQRLQKVPRQLLPLQRPRRCCSQPDLLSFEIEVEQHSAVQAETDSHQRQEVELTKERFQGVVAAPLEVAASAPQQELRMPASTSAKASLVLSQMMSLKA